jgi:beta-mannosidase
MIMRPRSQHDAALVDFVLVTSTSEAHARPGEVPWSTGLSCRVPCTVAGVLDAHGALDPARPPPLDAQDHWFRTQLPPLRAARRHVLALDGLATLAEVWLDGELLARSDAMFVPLRVALPEGTAGGAELALCFRALAPLLGQRRPRPRWKSRLVTHQTLRFVRTSLLGRTPGLSPDLPVVGPYRAVRVVAEEELVPTEAELRVGMDGDAGLVDVAVTIACSQGTPRSAELVLSGEGTVYRAPLGLTRHRDELRVGGRCTVPDAPRWWPHTHGAQPLFDAAVVLEGGVTITLGRVGFRCVRVERGADGRGFGLVLNGLPLFCRGAVLVAEALLHAPPAAQLSTLQQARAAGMNMLRIPGTATYPDDAFFDACDELGILVFQDFMFANLDYPVDDPALAASIEAEVRAQLARFAHRPCLALLCGGSEIAQQAAMLGLSSDERRDPLTSELLPRLVEELAPHVPYVPGSPSGGALPFQVDEGLSHYYGVGAYQRPLDDARRAEVRFTSECLAFAHLPHPRTIRRFMGELEAPFHHPRWKERVPRDRGASWDFEDVRDHYVELLFRTEARALRSRDPERYAAVCDAAVGQCIHATLSEFRRAGSSCRGALLYWLRDLWPGAGFGLIDALGRPKSAYFYAARAMAPFALALTDEGLNGLYAHALHDSPRALPTTFSVTLYRDGEQPLGTHTRDLLLPGVLPTRISVEAVLGRFHDTAYAYRFGPPGYDVCVASLVDPTGRVATAFHLPNGLARPRECDLGLRGELVRTADGLYAHLRTRHFAQHVTIDVPGYLPLDDVFHMAPGGERIVPLIADPASPAPRGKLRGTLTALNALDANSLVESET